MRECVHFCGWERSVADGRCPLARRNVEGVVCKLRQRVLAGETEGEARAAARAMCCVLGETEGVVERD